MATLIRDDQQVKACEDINAMLSEVQVLNRAILSEADSFTITVGRGGNGRRFPVDKVYNDKLIAVFKQMRVKRIKDIKAKAAKYHVGLDDADLTIISDAAIEASAAAEASPAPAEDRDPYNYGTD